MYYKIKTLVAYTITSICHYCSKHFLSPLDFSCQLPYTFLKTASRNQGVVDLMSRGTIIPTEVQPFEEAHAGEEVYLLDVFGVRFGFLYVTRWASTLGWSGTLRFSRLENEVLENLSFLISAEKKWRARNAINVFFALANKSSIECNLEKPEDFTKYKYILRQFNQISFVRYDVTNTSIVSPLVYSFTAENPDWLDTKDGELTIKLPKYQPWSANILNWIIEHHSSATFLKNKVDLQEISATLSKLSRS